ncbi:adenosine receptor A2b-like [Exaiptasia diaphana]|uniref:G-protein coupled receptors family 1 profile domain-containing protein n=1 Tax=Exaiptasia diaphana TaxID=2652724 RepID=A0A913YP99_EXADI|nr:adenosine receptor A2b-like [Exaiptasia diaphana]
MVLCIPPTVLLNVLVLIGIYKTPSLHTPNNVLLWGLALTDLGVGVLAMPLFTVKYVAFYTKNHGLWCESLALLTKVLQPPFCGISIATLTLISIDRVIALKFHLRYASMVTTHHFTAALVIVWIMAFTICLTYLINVNIIHWSTVFIFGVCLIICSSNNTFILRTLHRHRVDIQRQHDQVQINVHSAEMAQRRKSSRNMLWVYLMFIVCYVPFLAMRTARNYNGTNTDMLHAVYEISYALTFLNSLINPVFYCIRMRRLRKAMLSWIPITQSQFCWVCNRVKMEPNT